MYLLGWLHFDNLRYLDADVAEDWKPKYFPQKNDVILNSTGQGTLGRAQVYPDDKRRAIDSHVTLLRTDDELLPQFHRYFLESHLGQALLYSMCVNGSTGQIELSKTRLDLLPTPIPPPDEQHKIATILYTIDEAIQKTDELIEQTERTKRGLAQDLFSYSINDQQTADTWLGEIPETWDIVKFKELVESNRNGLYKSKEAYGEGYPIAKMGNALEERVLDMSTSDRLELTESEQEKYGLKQGDLIFARRAQEVSAAGDCCYVPELDELTVFESSLIRVRLTDQADPRFYTQYFEGPIGSKAIERIVTETSISGIATSDLLELKTALPPLEEQREIASILWDFDKQVEALQDELDQYKQFKQGLMQDLLSGEVRTTDADIDIHDEIRQHG
jgi:type I restriction enzyme S subunit